MNKNFVIIMMGFTGTGKSTTAKYLSQHLPAAIFHSATTRKELNFTFSKGEAKDDFFDLSNEKRKEMDRQVYIKNAQYCVSALGQGKDVILDSGHFFFWQRKLIYQQTESLHPEIFILRTTCDESVIKKRFIQRAKDFDKDVFSETPSFKAYESCKLATEYPDGIDQLPSGDKPVIIEFDTERHKAILIQGVTSKIVETIIQLLENW